MNTPGLIIGAAASGSGKTVFTLALLRALKRRGLRLTSAKVGPDYIDPAFHAAASGHPCVNLDSWAMRPRSLAQQVETLGRDSDLILCEGVMGLFDGADVVDGGPNGSTADLAARTGWPVILLGVAAILAAIAYTGGPLPFGYYGLGDIFVFIFFGVMCVAGLSEPEGARGVACEPCSWAATPTAVASPNRRTHIPVLVLQRA